MADLQGWQKVAREIGDYVCSNEEGIILPGEGAIPGAEHYPDDTPLVGDWLPAEAAAKEILRLRERVAVLEKVLDAAEDAVNWVSDPRWRHPLFVAVIAAAEQQQETDR